MCMFIEMNIASHEPSLLSNVHYVHYLFVYFFCSLPYNADNQVKQVKTFSRKFNKKLKEK